MAPPRELLPFAVSRGELLYKTADVAEWKTLLSPVNDPKHNCYPIKFESGVILSQNHREHGSICHVKLILKPPRMEIEDGERTVEAVCVEIREPRFSAFPNCEDKEKAIEHAKTLPLALLDKSITSVKLRHLQGKRWTVIKPDDFELLERIWELIQRGYRAWGAAQMNGSRPGQTKQLYTVLSRPSDSSTETSAELSDGSTETSAEKPTLDERLQAHHVATAEGEQRLRLGFEDDKQAAIRAIAVAIDGEWERKVAAAVTEYQAQRASIMERIAAEEKL